MPKIIHECSKEADLAMLKTDTTWIKQNVQDINKKLDTIIETNNANSTLLSNLNKTVYGNGKDGLDVKVSNIEEYVSEVKGVSSFVKFAAGSGWLFGIVALVISKYFL